MMSLIIVHWLSDEIKSVQYNVVLALTKGYEGNIQREVVSGTRSEIFTKQEMS